MFHSFSHQTWIMIKIPNRKWKRSTTTTWCSCLSLNLDNDVDLVSGLRRLVAPLRGLSLSAGSPTHPGWRALAGENGPQGLDGGDRLVVVEGFINGTKLELF